MKAFISPLCIRLQMTSSYIIGILLVAITVFAIYYAVYSPNRLSSAEAKQRLGQNEFDLVLDVRTNLERRMLGYYPGSLHIQSADLDAKMPILFPNRNVRILVYCNTGHRARMAVEKLRRMGYNNSYYIASTYTTLL